MRRWLCGKPGGLVAFCAIAALVAGGLGWATAAALRLEREQAEARAEAEHQGKLRLALWRLDSLVSPALAKENSRPYNHYSALFAPSLALQSTGAPWPPGTVLEPSPLLSDELPEWMLLHFQVAGTGWSSPQVLSPTLDQGLSNARVQAPLPNVTPARAGLLTELAGQVAPEALRTLVEQRGAQLTLTETALLPSKGSNYDVNPSYANPGPAQQQADVEYQNRALQRAQLLQQKQMPAQNDALGVAIGNTTANGETWLARGVRRPISGRQVAVTLGPLVPLWLPASASPEQLVLARLVQVDENQVCQGILLDWPRLQTLLRQEVEDLFPAAVMQPVQEEVPAYSERTMTALPVRLDPGAAPLPAAPGWTPLRIGLGLAWLAALVALAAVGLGGWSLLDLSERRFRFVSAVTHELRTPLTTLRLYLDMLAGGMIRDEAQKAEYLQTLNAEADRLNRLVGNVLDFSRLENQRPRLAWSRVTLGELLAQVQATWEGRCQAAAKELVIEAAAGADLELVTDVQLVQQVLGNLIDNACKYSRDAADPRLWLRAQRERPGWLTLDVEDRGPGVAPAERRAVFRAFRRGRGADVTAGGVGLGLALAQRWTALLGGRLALHPGREGVGACFRLTLPLPKA